MARSKGTASRRAPSKKKIAEGPKKPLSAYILFSNHRRSTLFEEKPELKSNVPAASRLLGEEWRNMEDADKQPFLVEAREAKEKYQIEKKAWDKRQEARGTGGDDEEDDDVDGGAEEEAPKPAKKVKKTTKTTKKAKEEDEEDSGSGAAAAEASGKNSKGEKATKGEEEECEEGEDEDVAAESEDASDEDSGAA